VRALAIVALLTASAQAGVLQPPRHYAALFELHHAWTYDLAVTTWDFDHPHKKKTVRSVVTCTVARVAKLDKVFVSEVGCDDDIPVAGFYVATAAGLYRVTSWIDKIADLGELDAPWIAAAPKAFHKKTHDDFFKADYIQGIKKQGLGWCIYDDTSGFADGGPTRTCFDKGIASGLVDVGGELHRVEFTAR
jgi:hypothetical protein